MRRITLLSPAVCFVAAIFCNGMTASAASSFTCDWEDGASTIIGQYSDIIATNVSDPVHGGSRSLKLEDAAVSGTPQAYLTWVTGLQDGDVVTASFWAYDTTPSGSPSTRIWAHYNDDPDDVTGYNASASGNDDYPAGDGWSELAYTWNIADGHTGLIIEARTYSNPGDTVWIDDLTITVPDHAGVLLPQDVAVPEPGSVLLLLGSIAMALALRFHR